MKDFITSDEMIDYYEDSLVKLSRDTLLLIPHKCKEEGNNFIKSGLYERSTKCYVKALMAFHYLLNHKVLTVTEEVIKYIDRVVVI